VTVVIIKGERITSSRSATPLLQHLMHGEENDRVTLIQGTEEGVREAFADARDADKKFALRHFIISPESETTRAEAMMVLGLLAQDFAFDPVTAIAWEHDKPRAVAAFGTHWHALVPEIIDTASGPRVMGSRFSYLRHVKVARIAEHRLKQNFVRSNHEAACLAALESDGHLDVAAALRAHIDADPGEAHREAFSRDTHQMGKRKGVDIPKARAAVRVAWETTRGRDEFESALAGQQLRVRSGEKPATFIIESLDGVFVGAAHRLARVRRLDFRVRMEGEAHVSDHSTAQQRQTIFRASTLGNSEHQESFESIGSARRHQGTRGGSSLDVAGIHRNRDPGSTSEQRSPTPAHRCYRSLRARGSARRVRKVVNRSPIRLQKIVKTAAFLAQPPVQRVAYCLARYEERLEGRLRALLSHQPLSPALAAARREATHLRARVDKYAKAIAVAQREVRGLTASSPRGLGPRIDGSRHSWEQRLAAAEARCVALGEKHSVLRLRLDRMQGSIADLEKSAARQHRQTLRSAEAAAHVARLRQQIERVRASQGSLGKFPVLAWGGIVMALSLEAAITEVDRVVETESGPSTSYVMATDIWGVGRREPPAS
jgi:hypothetical protein